MAIEFARVSIITRGAGHSVVKAAAYRSGEKLHDEQINRTADYSHRASEVMASEVLLPKGADQRLLDRATLWNEVENRENLSKRSATAQLAKDHVIALPKELNLEHQIELARSFAHSQFVSKGLVVDMNIHYHSDGNPHAHLLTTTRCLEGSEFGLKYREGNGDFNAGQKIPAKEQLRHAWSEHQNAYFKANGIDLSVSNNNGEYQAERHLGPGKWIEENGSKSVLALKNDEIISGRAAAILENPEIVIERVADRKSVFTHHDLYRELNKLVHDEVVYGQVKAKLENHDSLVVVSEQGGKAKLTTQSNVDMELSIRAHGQVLSRESKDFELPEHIVAKAMAKQSILSDEQKQAVVYATGAERLASVVGLAGAGKSTMLSSLREAYESNGNRVSGIALAGKAAEELKQSAGIESRTIASWLLGVKTGRIEIGKGDVLVMDEAGMVNNKTADKVLSVVENAGAKLVMVGDSEQLQPIQAGAPFRVLCEQHGSANIETIRRQKVEWQREATFNLAKGRGRDALAAYEKHGFVHSSSTTELLERLVNDFVHDRGKGSQAILAHRNVDVKSINIAVRDSLKAQGELDKGVLFEKGRASSDIGVPMGTQPGDLVRFTESNAAMGFDLGDTATFIGVVNDQPTLQLDDGQQLVLGPQFMPMLQPANQEKASDLTLAVGDRILFTKNDNLLGVKNGMLGDLKSIEKGVAVVELDDGKTVAFTANEYDNIDYGYATTIHKSQGMSVDRAYLYGSNTMDMHLGYVGMSRHREELNVYLNEESDSAHSFGDRISRSNRQLSVLDLFDPNENSSVIEPLTEDVLMDNTAFAQPQAIAPEFSSEDVLEAQATLDHTQNMLAQDLQQKSELQIAGANQALEQARAAFQDHFAKQPTPGLFTSNKSIEQWSATKLDLAAQVQQKSNACEAFVAHRNANGRDFRAMALDLAKQRHPDEAELVRSHSEFEKSRELESKLFDCEKEVGRSDLSPKAREKANRDFINTAKQYQDSGKTLSAGQKERLDKVINERENFRAQQKQMAKSRERGNDGMEM